jgi:hypothetical protein
VGDGRRLNFANAGIEMFFAPKEEAPKVDQFSTSPCSTSRPYSALVGSATAYDVPRCGSLFLKPPHSFVDAGDTRKKLGVSITTCSF